MENKYKVETLKNIFKLLNDDCSLWLLGLCLASNDIVMFQKQKDNCLDSEKTYFFAISLSILREIAKHITTNKNVDIEKYFSEHTNTLFSKLSHELKPFQPDSLTKGVLKPIRDTTFHYNFSYDKENREKLLPFLEDLKKESKLKLRVNPKDTSIFGQSYYFADIFRHKFHDSLLNNELIDKLSTVTCGVFAFVDSLLADLRILLKQMEGSGSPQGNKAGGSNL